VPVRSPGEPYWLNNWWLQDNKRLAKFQVTLGMEPQQSKRLYGRVEEDVPVLTVCVWLDSDGRCAKPELDGACVAGALLDHVKRKTKK